MKNMNKKGFVMAETIIVSVFVMTIVSFLILNVLPLVGEYERLLNYDTVEAKYNAHLIRKMILMSNTDYKEAMLNIGTNNYQLYTKSGFCNKYSDYTVNSITTTYVNNCFALLGEDYLNVKNVIISSYVVSSLQENVNTVDISRAFKDYIKYIPSYENGQYSSIATAKRLLIEFGDGTFSNIEVIE